MMGVGDDNGDGMVISSDRSNKIFGYIDKFIGLLVVVNDCYKEEIL